MIWVGSFPREWGKQGDSQILQSNECCCNPWSNSWWVSFVSHSKFLEFSTNSLWPRNSRHWWRWCGRFILSFPKLRFGADWFGYSKYKFSGIHYLRGVRNHPYWRPERPPYRCCCWEWQKWVCYNSRGICLHHRILWQIWKNQGRLRWLWWFWGMNLNE